MCDHVRVGVFAAVALGCGASDDRPQLGTTSSAGASTSGESPSTTSHGASTSTSSAGDESTLDDASGGESSPLDLGVPAEPLRVAVLADLNGPYGSTDYESTVHDAAAAIAAMQPDLVLSTGDMVAGQQEGLDYPAMWAGFHAAVSDVLAASDLPFAISPGNHDASGYPAFAAERDEFVAQWLPRKPALDYVDDADYPLRYAFVAGPALFVSLDSTTIGPLDAEQMAWLDEVLVAGAELPAKIVYGHVPLWPVAVGREDEIIGDPALETLLVERGVTLFVGGHHHAYYPGRHGGLHHVVTACVGSGPRALVGTADPAPKAILYFELDGAGELVVLDALAAPTFAEAIDRATLPASITVGAITLERDDGV